MAHPVKGSRMTGNMTNDGYHTTTYDAEGRGVSGDGGAYTVTINALGEGVQFWNSAGGGATPFDVNEQNLGLYTFWEASLLSQK